MSLLCVYNRPELYSVTVANYDQRESLSFVLVALMAATVIDHPHHVYTKARLRQPLSSLGSV